MAQKLERRRLSSGTPGLDEMLGGGFVEGTATLVSGAPGLGKTTLGLQYLCAGAAQGEAGLMVTFEEFPASLIRDAKQLGWDLQQLQNDGLLRLLFTSPQVFLSSLQAPDSPLAETIRTMAPRRAVLDSAAHFQRLTSEPTQLRETFNALVNGLKRERMTTLILDEAASLINPRKSKLSGLPFLVDSVLLLRYVEVDSTMQRAIAVLKMRGSQHQKEIRRFEIGPGGLHIGEPFTDFQGILSGSSQRIR
ncbi:MAG: RAD55 family ATPase [Anaerolineae bacterium]